MARNRVDTPVPPQVTCEHCKQVIDAQASVCYHCGKYRQFSKSVKDPIILSSFLATFLALLLFGASLWQANEASQANASAQQALLKVVESERQVAQAREDILGISQAVLEISEILPRSTGYGAGLSQKDRQRLQVQADFLRKKLEEHKFK